MRPRKQLYNLLRDIDLPLGASFDADKQDYLAEREIVPAMFAVQWPDGTPCVQMEMYLLDICHSLTVRRLDGGSLKTKINELTPLIRFCWDMKKNFWQLYDADFQGFVRRVRTERAIYAADKRSRCDNTVIKVIDSAIAFFEWLQKHLVCDRVIVGTIDENPQIPLVPRYYVNQHGKKRRRLIYKLSPTPSTPDPKRPMPREIRNRIWDAVEEWAKPGKLSGGQVTPNALKEKIEELDYLRARRELLLLLLEGTGCRPGELARFSTSANRNCVATGRTILPTLKRRRRMKRSIPIERGIAMKIELFIEDHRERLISRLTAKGKRPVARDRVFLCSKKGGPISERSMAKEFQRLVARAGIEQRACASMFRHRFITGMVRLHLAAFVSESGKTRGLITDADYRSILRKVATYTGHGSEQSLFHYIDWAWEEMGVFDYVQTASELCQHIEQSVTFVKSLKTELTLKIHLSPQTMLDRAVNELQLLHDRLQETVSKASRSPLRRIEADQSGRVAA